MINKDVVDAIMRADRLIKWMEKYIGKMSPDDYGDYYKDLNAHHIFMTYLKAFIIEDRPPSCAPEGYGGATGPTEVPEIPKGLNGPAGPFR